MWRCSVGATLVPKLYVLMTVSLVGVLCAMCPTVSGDQRSKPQRSVIHDPGGIRDGIAVIQR